MTSRERVLAAVAHSRPDRIPCDYWAGPEVSSRLRAHLGAADQEQLLRTLGVDLRYVTGPSYVGQELRTHPDGTVEDLWGVRREPVHVQRGPYKWTYRHAKASPLAGASSVEEVEQYAHWPSPDRWDYAGLAQECQAARGGHEHEFAVVNAGDRLDRTAQLKPMMYLRGMEQTYLDLAWNPDIVDAIVERIREYFLEYNRRVFDASRPTSGAGNPACPDSLIDIFMMGDDFGGQNGPLISLATWRRHFREGFRRYVELAHRYGIKVMHHTCGSVVELIPDFIECGLDILQSLQPGARGMELRALKREFGRDLCFHGGVDIQHTLPNGTPEQVREMVRRVRDAVGDDGGFILCTAHNIPPETPTENVMALFEAYAQTS